MQEYIERDKHATIHVLHFAEPSPAVQDTQHMATLVKRLEVAEAKLQRLCSFGADMNINLEDVTARVIALERQLATATPVDRATQHDLQMMELERQLANVKYFLTQSTALGGATG
jgi:hypothetical protein